MKVYTENQIVFAEAENLEDIRVLLNLGSRWPKAVVGQEIQRTLEVQPLVPVAMFKKPIKKRRTLTRLPNGKSQANVVLEKFHRDGWVDTDWFLSENIGAKSSLASVVCELKKKNLITIKTKGYTDESFGNYRYNSY